jgi:hypothetical protein
MRSMSTQCTISTENTEPYVARHAASYLPTDVTMTEDGNLKPPPPVSCLFGPIASQVQLDLKMFQTHRTCPCAHQLSKKSLIPQFLIIQRNLCPKALDMCSMQEHLSGALTGVLST